MIITEENIRKYLTLFYPYLAIIFYKIILYFFEIKLNINLDTEVENALFILLNGSSVIFGINTLNKYTHKENCKEYE